MAYEEGIEFPFQFEFPIFSEVPAPCMYAIKVKKTESNFCDMLADLKAEGLDAFFCKFCNCKKASDILAVQEESESEDEIEEDYDTENEEIDPNWKLQYVD